MGTPFTEPCFVSKAAVQQSSTFSGVPKPVDKFPHRETMKVSDVLSETLCPDGSLPGRNLPSAGQSKERLLPCFRVPAKNHAPQVSPPVQWEIQREFNTLCRVRSLQ